MPERTDLIALNPNDPRVIGVNTLNVLSEKLRRTAEERRSLLLWITAIFLSVLIGVFLQMENYFLSFLVANMLAFLIIYFLVEKNEEIRNIGWNKNKIVIYLRKKGIPVPEVPKKNFFLSLSSQLKSRYLTEEVPTIDKK